MTSHPRSPTTGFTLIEILVVLTILGLALGLLVARGPMRSPVQESRAITSELAESLRVARGKAIAANRPVRVLFDLSAHAFRVDGGPPRPLPTRMAMAVTTVSGNTFGQDLAGITFAPDGSSSGGRIELADGLLRTVIGVDWLTGRVSIADAY